MSDVTLGVLADCNAKRDAIHVAIVPIKSKYTLRPGVHVGFNTKGDLSAACDDCFGIVDPFLASNVMPGDTVYVLLYPNTVTGMRHHWEHPLFDSIHNNLLKKETGGFTFSKEESERWLRNAIEAMNCPSYEEIINAVKGISSKHDRVYYEIDDDYFCCDGTDAGGEIPDTFWEHVENVTGVKCKHKPKYFRCSCY